MRIRYILFLVVYKTILIPKLKERIRIPIIMKSKKLQLTSFEKIIPIKGNRRNNKGKKTTHFLFIIMSNYITSISYILINLKADNLGLHIKQLRLKNGPLLLYPSLIWKDLTRISQPFRTIHLMTFFFVPLLRQD